MSVGAEISGAARFLSGLPKFLTRPIDPRMAPALARERRERREERWLELLDRGVFRRPTSPYRRLFANAGATLADVRQLVGREGIGGALARLRRSGVFVTLAEFKGARPIDRGSLRIEVRAGDFDSPLVAPLLLASSSGSAGAPRRMAVDLSLFEHEAVSHALFLLAFGALDRPFAFWRTPPPGLAGVKNILCHARLGKEVERWFSPTGFTLAPARARFTLFTLALGSVSRISGRPIPWPEYTPTAEALGIARWAAAKVRAGTPPVIETAASNGVRVCAAAREAGLDLAGVLLRFGGEPLTEAKARLAGDVGARAVCHYSMAETGHVALACASPAAPDDVHLLDDKIAVVGAGSPPGGEGGAASRLLLTTLDAACPKLMINVEVGDAAVVASRRCGCLLDEVGYTTHLHTIRSYEKLTAEGVALAADELLRFLEHTLPIEFGGVPGDYQLLEQEERGLVRVAIVVSPRVGPVDESRLIALALKTLGEGHAGWGVTAEIWRQADALRVLRREPTATRGGKALPLAHDDRKHRS